MKSNREKEARGGGDHVMGRGAATTLASSLEALRGKRGGAGSIINVRGCSEKYPFPDTRRCNDDVQLGSVPAIWLARNALVS